MKLNFFWDETMIPEEIENFLRHLDTSLLVKMAVVEGIFSVKQPSIDQFTEERDLHFISKSSINPIVLLNALHKELIPFLCLRKILRKNYYRLPVAQKELD